MTKEVIGKIFTIVLFAGLMVLFHIGDLYSVGVLERYQINGQISLDWIGPIIIILVLISLGKDVKKRKEIRRFLK